MSQSISTLLIRNLDDVFGEGDPQRRRAAIDEIFTEDAVFYEPGAVHRGRDEIDRIAGVIRATHPTFRYTPTAAPQELHNAGRVHWVSGPPEGPSAYAGVDFIIVREDDNRRGRKRGETGELVRQGLLAAGFPSDRLSPEVFDEEEAVRRALETAQPGDLLVIFGDDLERVWQQIVSFGRPGGAAPVATTPPAPIFPPDERPLSSALAPAALESPAEARRTGEHED